jgi:hypothetical protein
MVLGNALNIFLNYVNVVEIWRKSGTRKDFLFKLLDMINDNGYGFYTLVYSNIGDGILGEPATIADARGGIFACPSKSKVYRFKPGTINSNVRNFSFNFELSDLVASRTIFNTQIKITEAANKKENEGKELKLEEDAYNSVDFSLYTNADGFYSINQIDYVAIKATYDDFNKEQKKGKKIGAINPNAEKEDNEAENYTEIIKVKSAKFKKENNDIVTLIYKDSDFLRDKMHATIKQKSTLSPIEVTIEIDGLSGISCGEYFEIDGVPEIYNQIGAFQVTNTKQNVSSEEWKTTIEARHRIIDKS